MVCSSVHDGVNEKAEVHALVRSVQSTDWPNVPEGEMMMFDLATRAPPDPNIYVCTDNRLERADTSTLVLPETIFLPLT